MVYEKKYPIAPTPGDSVLLTWERGYKNTTLHYRDEELITVENVQKLKKGVKFEHQLLGTIELILNENPTGVDVIINGFHSPINKNHPEKKIKSINLYFYIFASMLVTFLVYMNFSYPMDLASFLIVNIFEFIFLALYIISAIFSAKARAWAVYMGFCTYCAGTFLSLIAVLIGLNYFNVLISVMILGIRAALLFLLIPYLKTAVSLSKHNSLKQKNHNIIDQLS